MLELGARVAELGQADASGLQGNVVGLHDKMVIDVAQDPVLLHAHLERVPVTGPVMGAGPLCQDGPGVDVRSLEAGEAKLAAARVETVVLVAAVGMKDQAGGAGLVVQAHRHGELVRDVRRRLLRQADGTAAEAAAHAFGEDLARPLPPAAVEQGRPFRWVERADGQPARHGNGVGLLQERLEAIDRDGETQIGREQRLHGQDALHAPLQVEERAAAVAGLDGNGELNHRAAFQLTFGRDHATHHAVLQAVRVADGDDRLAFLQAIGIANGKRRQALDIDPDQGEIERAIGGMN